MTFKQEFIFSDSAGALKSNPMGSTKLPLLGRDGKAITLPIAVVRVLVRVPRLYTEQQKGHWTKFIFGPQTILVEMLI